ncbi:MAG: hypothetical protein AAGU19_01275 [Prolixibacteraceae bacterium]
MKLSTLMSAICLLVVLLSSCKKDEPTWEEQLYQDYGIDKLNLTQTSFRITESPDSVLCFSGLTENNHLWFGVYAALTKEKLFSWLSPEEAERTVVIDRGYGDVNEYSIEKYADPNVCIQGTTIWFAITLLSESYGVLCTNLYCSDGGVVVKNQLASSFNEFTSWFPGTVMIKIGQWGETVFNNKAELLFRIALPNMPVLTLLSPEELLSPITSVGEPFRRISLKTGIVQWVSSGVLKDLPQNTRIDKNEVLEQTDSFIIVKISYTQFSGEKGSETYMIDLATGKFLI